MRTLMGVGVHIQFHFNINKYMHEQATISINGNCNGIYGHLEWTQDL